MTAIILFFFAIKQNLPNLEINLSSKTKFRISNLFKIADKLFQI